jgi:hypothetical protein
VILFGIPLYVILIGFLNAQYTLTGYDASAHMSEETHDAHTSAPRGHRLLGRRLGDHGLHPLDGDERRDHAGQVFPAADGTRMAPPATSTRSTRPDAVECRSADHDLDRRRSARPVA